MIKRLQTFKEDIQPVEKKLIRNAVDDHSLRNKERLVEPLTAFIQSGKHLRGGLFLQAVSWLDEIHTNDLLTAASIEMLHSAMLIQDDIMDDDPIRRGQPSLHEQFRKINNDRRISEGMAVCASDILIFTTLETVSSLNNQESEIITNALRHVTLGQFRDITNDDPWNEGTTPTKEDIIDVYANKTGKYTFTMPLELAEARTDAEFDTLDNIGTSLGVTFQLRDDELNIFGASDKTGKPELSDVVENKHTILRNLLEEKHPEAEKFFGKSVEGKREEIKALFEKVHDAHGKIKQKYKHTAIEAIEESTLPQDGKQALKALAEFVATREK